MLTGQLRKRLMPALEDLPREEKVRRGNVLQKTRPRNVEESLLELINDEDEVIAAAAIDLVRERKLWELAPDIEHVLAHRDVHDWFVFESASWALAECRVPDRRRELWREPLPAAAIAWQLRAMPLFASVSVDELFRIAAGGRQVRHEPGRLLMQEGAVPDTVHLLLDGTVTMTSNGEAPVPIGAGARGTAKTRDLTVTLALPLEDLRTLLSDNTDLVRGLFATLASAPVPLVTPSGAGELLEQLAAGGLTAVEKVLALQRVPMFSRIGADDMLTLASATRTMLLSSGTRAFETSAAPALWVILSAELSIDLQGGGRATARAGDVIGTWAVLAGREIGASADVVRAGIALKLDREDLFDLLGQRPTLLQQMFAALFRGAAVEAAVA